MKASSKQPSIFEHLKQKVFWICRFVDEGQGVVPRTSYMNVRQKFHVVQPNSGQVYRTMDLLSIIFKVPLHNTEREQASVVSRDLVVASVMTL